MISTFSRVLKGLENIKFVKVFVNIDVDICNLYVIANLLFVNARVNYSLIDVTLTLKLINYACNDELHKASYRDCLTELIVIDQSTSLAL